MTAQISDVVVYGRRSYSVAGVKGIGLFEPSLHGLRPVALSTACWRGYYCRYRVLRGRLLLDTLHIGLGEGDARRAQDGTGPALFGALPRWDEVAHAFAYDRLRKPIRFTGGLLLGRDFIWDLYVHMGFHPGWKFREAKELLFRDGKLQEERDLSERMEQIRARLTPDDLRPRDPKKLREWIESTFSLQYELAD